MRVKTLCRIYLVATSLFLIQTEVRSTQRLDSELIEAAEKGDSATVKRLLDAGARVNSKDDWGTALIHAARAGSLAVVEILLAKGADVNARSKSDGETALFTALFSDYKDIVRALLRAGANTNAKNSDGLTPLMWAAANEQHDIVRLLNPSETLGLVGVDIWESEYCWANEYLFGELRHPVRGKVLLSAPAPPGGVVVTLRVDGLPARFLPSVTVPAGSTSEEFVIYISKHGTLRVTATVAGKSRTTTAKTKERFYNGPIIIKY